MSDEQLQAEGAAEAATGETESFLDRAIAATSQTAPDTTRELLATLTRQALEGTVVWSKNLTRTIEEAVNALDDKISRQLTEVLHQEGFQKLEGSWRGLNKLIRNSELGPQLKARVLDITRDELLEQFEEAPAVDRSRLFNMVYQHEFGTAGGEPYGVLLGDYTFSHNDEDVALLRFSGWWLRPPMHHLLPLLRSGCLSLRISRSLMKAGRWRRGLIPPPMPAGMPFGTVMMPAMWP